VRPAIRRAASFIRRWPAWAAAAGVQRQPGRRQGKIVDGNRICNELGFEYQYPDPLVMPME
jgi:hypothetical protein